MSQAPSPPVTLLLLNWNNPTDTLECLASLQQLTYPNVRILLIDNGSTDGSVETIRAVYPHLMLLETHENLGFAGGNNVGIQWALEQGSEWILLLNNDTLVAPDLIETFLSSAETVQGKILGAKILRFHDPQRIDHLGGNWDPAQAEFFSPASGKDDNGLFTQMESVDYVCGAALFMHRHVPQTIGLLDPRFFLFWEETDYCMRAKKAGFTIWTAPKARVWHKVSSSFVGGKPHTHYFWWRSRLLWIEKNCSSKEKRRLYRTILLPELGKSLRHLCIKSFLSFFVRPSPDRLAKIRKDQAALLGAWHYFRGRFGNIPNSFLRSISQ